MIHARFMKGLLALTIGCILNYLGDRLLGVQIELFYGLQTFSIAWMLDMFFVPLVVGFVVAAIFGMGGKWLCYFPPLIVRAINYALIAYSSNPLPQDSTLIPIGWWGLFVILTMESAAFGGIAGEIIIKGTYGRSAPSTIYKKSADDEEGDS